MSDEESRYYPSNLLSPKPAAYSYNFIVRKTGMVQWTIYSDKGIEMHVMHNCTNEDEVMRRANAWASSWHSASVKVENGEPKKGN